MKYNFLLLPIITVLILTSCQNNQQENLFSTQDSLMIINEILEHRAKQDTFFRNSSDSPFKRDTTIKYQGLKYFEPNLKFYFKSKLHKYKNPDTVVVLGTKGEERKQLKYGYFELNFEGKKYKINVYKFTPYDSVRYSLYKDHLSFWFRDKTTVKETYEVGRYVEIGKENPNPEHIYIIDLNKAYNPYCAYSPIYSCAIPREEDYLDFEVRAGEKKYHNHYAY